MPPLNFHIFRIIVKSIVYVKCINTPSYNGNFSDIRALRDFLTAGGVHCTQSQLCTLCWFCWLCLQPSVHGVLISPEHDQEGNKLMFLSESRAFPSAPCLTGKEAWWQLASRFCLNRARAWHASDLVSVLVGVRTYQLPAKIQPACVLWYVT